MDGRKKNHKKFLISISPQLLFCKSGKTNRKNNEVKHNAIKSECCLLPSALNYHMFKSVNYVIELVFAEFCIIQQSILQIFKVGKCAGHFTSFKQKFKNRLKKLNFLLFLELIAEVDRNDQGKS